MISSEAGIALCGTSVSFLITPAPTNSRTRSSRSNPRITDFFCGFKSSVGYHLVSRWTFRCGRGSRAVSFIVAHEFPHLRRQLEFAVTHGVGTNGARPRLRRIHPRARRRSRRHVRHRNIRRETRCRDAFRGDWNVIRFPTSCCLRRPTRPNRHHHSCPRVLTGGGNAFAKTAAKRTPRQTRQPGGG